MKNALAIALRCFAWTLVVLAIGAALWIYVPQRYDSNTGLYFDGVGRELHSGSGPFGFKGPGLLWEALDVVVAVGIFGFVQVLFVLARRLQRPPESPRYESLNPHFR